MKQKMLILRVSGDWDTFMNGAAPEGLWSEGESLDLAPEESVESADIFEIARLLLVCGRGRHLPRIPNAVVSKIAVYASFEF